MFTSLKILGTFIFNLDKAEKNNYFLGVRVSTFTKAIQ